MVCKFFLSWKPSKFCTKINNNIFLDKISRIWAFWKITLHMPEPTLIQNLVKRQRSLSYKHMLVSYHSFELVLASIHSLLIHVWLNFYSFFLSSHFSHKKFNPFSLSCIVKFSHLEPILSVILSSFLCLINSHVLCKEKLGVDNWLGMKGIHNTFYSSLFFISFDQYN